MQTWRHRLTLGHGSGHRLVGDAWLAPEGDHLWAVNEDGAAVRTSLPAFDERTVALISPGETLIRHRWVCAATPVIYLVIHGSERSRIERRDLSFDPPRASVVFESDAALESDRWPNSVSDGSLVLVPRAAAPHLLLNGDGEVVGEFSASIALLWRSWTLLDGERVAAQTSDGNVSVFDRSGRVLTTITVTGVPEAALTRIDEHRLLLVDSAADAFAPRPLFIIDLLRNRCDELCVGPFGFRYEHDARELAVCAYPRGLTFYSLDDGSIVRRRDVVGSVIALSARWVVIDSPEQLEFVPREGALDEDILRPPFQRVAQALFAADGETLVTRDAQCTVRWWRLPSGACLAERPLDEDAIRESFHPALSLLCLCEGGALTVLSRRVEGRSIELVACAPREGASVEQWSVLLEDGRPITVSEDGGAIVVSEDLGDPEDEVEDYGVERARITLHARRGGASPPLVLVSERSARAERAHFTAARTLEIVFDDAWLSFASDGHGEATVLATALSGAAHLCDAGMVTAHASSSDATEPSGLVLRRRDGAVCRWAHPRGNRVLDLVASTARSVELAAASSFNDPTVYLVNFDGETVATLALDCDDVATIALSDDGTRLAIGTSRGVVHVYEREP